jgi:hypothetical protein
MLTVTQRDFAMNSDIVMLIMLLIALVGVVLRDIDAD